MTIRADNLKMQLLPPSFEPWQKGGDDAIAVMMSGGVDSSATALLMQRAGRRVLGITMKIPVAQQCDHPRPCCGAEAALVCHKIGVPHYFIDVGEAFDEFVIEPFRRAYGEGRTPNPCVDCNTFLKFGAVWDFIETEFGIRDVATGHYAQVRHVDGRTYLTRGADRARDQSYFIYGLPHDRLPHLALPLGELTKPEVREIARDAGLDVAETQDSMELCFAGEGDYRKALGADVNAAGPILDAIGNEVGRHDGIRNYTIGQRRGLRVAVGEPVYVSAIHPADNTVVIGTRGQVCRRDVIAQRVNVLLPERLETGERLIGKIRSYDGGSHCSITRFDGDEIETKFDEPQFAPTPGQHLVLYDYDDNVVAGGVIRDQNH